MSGQRSIYGGIKNSKVVCPICGSPAIAIGPQMGDKSQHYECQHPKCAVLGFRNELDRRLIAIWLGKLRQNQSIGQASKAIATKCSDLRSDNTLLQKRKIWNYLCNQFAKREHKTTIELRAIKKLQTWEPKYDEGIVVLVHRLPNPTCLFLEDRNSSTDRISVSQQEGELK